MFDFRIHPFCHRPGHYPLNLQPGQSRPQTVLGHLWREYPKRCRVYRHVRVSRDFFSVIFTAHLLTRSRTLSRFHGEDIYISSLFHGVGIFLFSFFISMLLGVAFGLCCSLGLKHSHLSSYPAIESCLVALVAYTSYFFSNGLSMSGEPAQMCSMRKLILPRHRLAIVLRYHP